MSGKPRRPPRSPRPGAQRTERTLGATPLPPSPADRPKATRIDAIDTLRGVAICSMIVYHFAYDLRIYRVTNADFVHDPFWLAFRALIVTSFMVLVGISLVLAEEARATHAHFWRRIAVIVACALLVTLASWVAFRETFIYFGILHAIAVASVLVSPLVSRPRAALLTGAAIIAAGVAWSNAWFDPRAHSWIGFATTKPPTEDYVPLAPWAGVVALGVAAGHGLVRDGFRKLAPLGNAPAWLRWLGRHSLFVYMIHQPLLLGALWLVVRR